MLLEVPLLLVTLLAVISPSACELVRETNRERLARGLPPLPPKFGRSMPGLFAREPTPVQVAKRGQASALPPISVEGCIQARDIKGNVLGSVQNTNTTSTVGGINKSGIAEHDLKVRFTAPRSGKGPFDIIVTNPTFPAPFYIGASRLGDNKLRLDSTDTLTFTNVQQTPPFSTPVVSTYQNSVVESSLWSYDPRTKELTAQYVNTDQTTSSPVLAYNLQQNLLFFVVDIDAYNKDNTPPVSAVKLFVS